MRGRFSLWLMVIAAITLVLPSITVRSHRQNPAMIDVAQATISATQAATEAANPCTNQPFHTLLTADDVQNPVVKQDPTTGQYTVSFTLTDAAEARFSDFTAKHAGQ